MTWCEADGFGSVFSVSLLENVKAGIKSTIGPCGTIAVAWIKSYAVIYVLQRSTSCQNYFKASCALKPCSGKLSREKTFANWWKIRFSWRKRLWSACWCHQNVNFEHRCASGVGAPPLDTQLLNMQVQIKSVGLAKWGTRSILQWIHLKTHVF